jgi:hypothetical protein
MNRNGSLIFIWIGVNHPCFLFNSIKFAHQQNSNKNIILLAHKLPKVWLNALNKIGVELIDYEIFDSTYMQINPESLAYTGEFWINTSLRFCYLKEVVFRLKIEKFFHAELDNAIFNLDGLDGKLDRCGNGLFVPRDASDRAIASLIYCNRPESLRELTALYSSATPPKHDMDALAMYSRDYPSHFFSLPTESYAKNRGSWRILAPDFLGGLFDAAAIGQYMLGVDPIHRKGRPSYNGFINENSKINWDEVVFDTDGKNLFLGTSGKAADNYRLYNLHIHAKNWKAFKSLLNNGPILKRLQKGKPSIISGRIFVIFGWAYIPLVHLSALIKKFFK